MTAVERVKYWHPYRPNPEAPWNTRRVVHLHRRAALGATWKEIQRDLRDGPHAAVDRLLLGTSRTVGVPDEFESMAAFIEDAAVRSNDSSRLKASWLYRMLFTPDPLAEKLTLMWHNHFATSNLKVNDVGLMRRQNAILREFARAPFGELLRRAVKDPAMLVWLDAQANRKEHSNENLAREIMELFALGVGNYSEADVKEAARALTGWSVHHGEFRSAERHHDDGAKSIFGKQGHWTGDDLIRLLIEHPAAPKRLAFRICELLMGESVASRAAIEELAAGLRERDLSVGWAVETVLRSEAFFAEQNIGARVMDPVAFVVGATRALEMFVHPPSTLLLAEATARLGQDLFYPPNVFGWPGGRSWLTTRAIIGRANFVTALAHGKMHASPRPLDAAVLANAYGFTKPDGIASFFAQLLLGKTQLPAEFHHLVGAPNRLVVAIAASPEAQLG